MALVNLSVKHGVTVDEARAQLHSAVDEAQARLGPLLQKVEWSADRQEAMLSGAGYHVELRVDAVELRITGDVPMLGGLLGGPLMAGLKGIVQKTFPKALPL